MKNFEHLEQLWRQQTVVVRGDPQKIQAAQSAAERIVRSQGRLLRLGIGVTIVSLLLGQLLTVVNFVHAGRAPTVVALTHFALLQIFQIGLLVLLLRRTRAHRRLRARAAASVGEHVEASLELIEGEIRDHQLGARVLGLLLVLDVVPMINGWLEGYYDGAGALARIAFIAALGGLLLAVSGRHVRRVLQPRAAELRELRREIAGG